MIKMRIKETDYSYIEYLKNGDKFSETLIESHVSNIEFTFDSENLIINTKSRNKESGEYSTAIVLDLSHELIEDLEVFLAEMKRQHCEEYGEKSDG